MENPAIVDIINPVRQLPNHVCSSHSLAKFEYVQCWSICVRLAHAKMHGFGPCSRDGHQGDPSVVSPWMGSLEFDMQWFSGQRSRKARSLSMTNSHDGFSPSSTYIPWTPLSPKGNRSLLSASPMKPYDPRSPGPPL